MGLRHPVLWNCLILSDYTRVYLPWLHSHYRNTIWGNIDSYYKTVSYWVNTRPWSLGKYTLTCVIHCVTWLCHLHTWLCHEWHNQWHNQVCIDTMNDTLTCFIHCVTWLCHSWHNQVCDMMNDTLTCVINVSHASRSYQTWDMVNIHSFRLFYMGNESWHILSHLAFVHDDSLICNVPHETWVIRMVCG